MKIHIWLAALLLFIATPSLCLGQSQQEMNREAAADAEQADAELNKVYQQLMATLDDEGKNLLKVSQRAWLVYRDAEAAFAADAMRGGSAAPLLYSGTLARLTEQRTAVLRDSMSER